MPLVSDLSFEKLTMLPGLTGMTFSVLLLAAIVLTLRMVEE
jgi:hypothetical protein